MLEILHKYSKSHCVESHLSIKINLFCDFLLLSLLARRNRLLQGSSKEALKYVYFWIVLKHSSLLPDHLQRLFLLLLRPTFITLPTAKHRVISFRIKPIIFIPPCVHVYIGT